MTGVETDRADQEPASGFPVTFGQLRQRRAALAGHALDHARRREPGGFLGQEHQGRPPLLGRRHGDQERHGDLLRILQARRQADDRLAPHAVSSPRPLTCERGCRARDGQRMGQLPHLSRRVSTQDPEGFSCARPRRVLAYRGAVRASLCRGTSGSRSQPAAPNPVGHLRPGRGQRRRAPAHPGVARIGDGPVRPGPAVQPDGVL